MTIFEDLRVEYQRAREASLQYLHNSAFFAQRLAHRFQTYIGAPESYTSVEREKRWYVRTMRVRITEPGKFATEEPDGLHDLLTRDEDGQWLLGLRLTLDVAANTYPKDNFVFLLKFTIREEMCEMSVGFENRTFKFRTDDDDGIKPLFDHMIQQIKEMFSQPPWQTAKKNAIGFVPSQTD